MIVAPAKVNLTLGVLGKRTDGFHDVDTTILALDWGDRVGLAADEGPWVRVAGPAATSDVPSDERNLAHRAAAAIAELVGATAPRLWVEKNIPSRAGLGGGSADAAAAAYLTAEHFGLDFDDEQVVRALANLGADCAFFLTARRTGIARCTGRGERVKVLDAELPWWFVVTTPIVTCSTPEVWRAVEPGDWRGAPDPQDALESQDLGRARDAWSNDLERAAYRVAPELAAWRELLDDLGEGHQRLAGSGSSFFGAYESEAAARAAREHIAAEGIARNLGLRAQCVARARGAAVGP